MPLSAGTHVGSYQILSAIGAGGMGEVYRARDARLDRDVAVKVLPDLFSSDADRLARFEREARTLASLNHPNVAGIHGIEEHGGRRYLILEYVAGETLADRLDRGPLPFDEALDIAVQIARGIEAAHEAGVIHRDLKPGNVVVTPEGQAKVLDFGLARMEETSSSGAAVGEMPTLTSPARHSPTVAGVILGTAAYMSPEQARGRRVDRRTDIWSFGVVLLEMLTGANPFAGETVSDSIGAILHKEADVTRLAPDTPPMVRHVLRRCLARDRDQRYRDIGDARLDLLDAGAAAAPPAARRSLAPLMVVCRGAGPRAGRHRGLAARPGRGGRGASARGVHHRGSRRRRFGPAHRA
jgi:eukaryotic-like serine/threonine-protein kinase